MAQPSQILNFALEQSGRRRSMTDPSRKRNQGMNDLEIMIDIETLDIRPMSVVLSIGAVIFTQKEGPVDSFYRKLDFQQQINKGRLISEQTLLWWLQQDEAAIKEAFSRTRCSTPGTLLELNMFLATVGDANVWANSPAFDLVIMETLYKDFDIKIPWGYSNGRDMRTLRDVAQMPHDWKPDINGMEHHPVHDCNYQIEVVREARRRIFMTMNQFNS